MVIRKLTAYDFMVFKMNQEYSRGVYQNPETQENFKFISFVEGSKEGQVQARNLESSEIEILTLNDWFSFDLVSSAQSQPMCTEAPEGYVKTVVEGIFASKDSQTDF